jgi:hypothetical protein
MNDYVSNYWLCTYLLGFAVILFGSTVTLRCTVNDRSKLTSLARVNRMRLHAYHFTGWISPVMLFQAAFSS